MHISWVESLERECKDWQVFIDAAVAELLDVDRYERRTEPPQWFWASDCLHGRRAGDQGP